MTVKGEWDKKQTKVFEKRISRDFLDLKYADGKKNKLACDEGIDAKTPDPCCAASKSRRNMPRARNRSFPCSSLLLLVAMGLLAGCAGWPSTAN
jgi:hypothetical protein